MVKLVGKLSEKGTSLRINGSEEIFHGEALSSKYLARFMASVGGENILSGDALQATQVDYIYALHIRIFAYINRIIIIIIVFHNQSYFVLLS